MPERLVISLNRLVWSTPLVLLCLLTGLFFSLRLHFPQLRLFGQMLRCTVSAEKSGHGITPFQAFTSTVGARVGMGNIAGVAAAIRFGGPGAVLWMWVIALLGAASAFAESVLAQAYKIRLPGSGEYAGGPAYYIERGLGKRVPAVLYAAAAVFGSGLAMPGLQTHQLTAVLQDTFGIAPLLTALLLTVCTAAVIFGSVRRIGRAAEQLAPVMCVLYLQLAVLVILVRWSAVGSVFALIIRSAIGKEPVFGAIIGSAVSRGVTRGVYSSEAGQGTGAVMAAAAETSHPVRQGLVQILSVFIDTLVVCTATALMILCSGFYSVAAPDGTLLYDGASGTEYGILYALRGIQSVLGSWSGTVLAVCAALFVFTSLTGCYYQAESNLRWLCRGKDRLTAALRAVFLLSVFSGAFVSTDALWALGELGSGVMTWINLFALLGMSGQVRALLNDFERQLHRGLEPLFDPAVLHIQDIAGVWSVYAARRRSRR